MNNGSKANVNFVTLFNNNFELISKEMNVDTDLDVLYSDLCKSPKLQIEKEVQVLFEIKKKCQALSNSATSEKQKIIESFYNIANHRLGLALGESSKNILFQEIVYQSIENTAQKCFLLSFSRYESQLFVLINDKRYLWNYNNFYLRPHENKHLELSIENEVMLLLNQNPKLSMLHKVLKIMDHIVPKMIIFETNNVMLQYDDTSVDDCVFSNFAVFVQEKRLKCQLNNIIWDFDASEFQVRDLFKIVVPNYANNKKSNVTMILDKKPFYEFGFFLETFKDVDFTSMNFESEIVNKSGVFFECTAIDSYANKICNIQLQIKSGNYILKVDSKEYSFENINDVVFDGNTLKIRTHETNTISFKSKLWAEEFFNIVHDTIIDGQIFFQSENIKCKLEDGQNYKKTSFKLFEKDDKYYYQIGKLECEVKLNEFKIKDAQPRTMTVRDPFSSTDKNIVLLFEDNSEFEDFKYLINGKTRENMMSEFLEIEKKYEPTIKKDGFWKTIFEKIKKFIKSDEFHLILKWAPIVLTIITFIWPMHTLIITSSIVVEWFIF